MIFPAVDEREKLANRKALAAGRQQQTDAKASLPSALLPMVTCE